MSIDINNNTTRKVGIPPIAKANGLPAEKYREYLKGKTVAVVGPASSIVGSEYGYYIESHDIIVRVNRGAKINKNLTQDIGGRTDVLYHCLHEEESTGAGQYNVDEWVNAGIQWVICPYPETPLFIKDIVEFKKRNSKRIDFLTLDEKIFNYYKDEMYTRPNTGTLAMLHLLTSDLKSLFITGFTFMKTGYIPTYRNKEDADRICGSDDDGAHNFNKQFQYMKTLFCVDKRVELDNTLKKLVAP